MSITNIVSLIITLFFVYFIISLVASTTLEIISSIKNRRSKELFKWIDSTFGTETKDKLAKHKLIDGLTREGRTCSYIPKEIFSRALLDIVNEENHGVEKLTYTNEEIIESIKTSTLKPGFKKYVLQTALEKSNSIEDIQDGIEEWYESAMTRISGTYKVKSQSKMFWLSVLVAAAFNLDTAQIINKLSSNPAKTNEIAEQVSNQMKTDFDSLIENDSTGYYAQNKDSLKIIASNALDTYTSAGIVVNWEDDPVFDENEDHKTQLWLKKIFGILVSALAGSLGAPFWYELINKIANIKGSGNKPEVVVKTVNVKGKEENEGKG